MSKMQLALAEELERLAAGYRMLANHKPDEITIQDISYLLNEKVAEGKMQKIKDLLEKYSAVKLVDVKAEDYPSFFKEAKKL